MAEQDIPPPTITAMKIPIIRKGEYDIWSMRMRQYICHTDHNLWDVIVNGDLEEEPAPTGETSAPPAPKTAKQLAARRNQERVKSILLLAIPDEYLLKFHNVADAKSLWEAIKSRFGGNVESKKMQKNVLKHQFENFSTASNESLDKAYDRYQVTNPILTARVRYVFHIPPENGLYSILQQAVVVDVASYGRSLHLRWVRIEQDTVST
ncbi:hypothetical protein Tco_1439014 [Tanacetum coccineum]